MKNLKKLQKFRNKLKVEKQTLNSIFKVGFHVENIAYNEIFKSSKSTEKNMEILLQFYKN